MREVYAVLWATLVGGTTGAIFFGGLWWTIRRGLVSKTPAAWFLGSFALRTGVVLLGFYSVYDGDWRRVLSCTLGFLVARGIAVRMGGRPWDPRWRRAGTQS